MFVYIVGNTEQSIFKLGIAVDPFQSLSSLQEGNPYRLSLLCKLCMSSKNEANLVEQLGRKGLEKYEGARGWYVGVPESLSAQFAGGHYLRLLASQAGAACSNRQTAPKGRTNLQRLIPIAKRSDLSFEDVFEKVERAYTEGVPIDGFFDGIN